MEFRLLGPLEVALDTGQAPELARAKERCLLAVLAMNAGRVISRDKLISYVWEEDPRGTENFRSYMVSVRRVVEATGGQAELVRSESGYQLRVPADRVDALRLTRLRHQADASARAGNTDQAVALLCEAEALGNGRALADIGDGRWATEMRAALEEERRACLLKRIGLELDLGHHAELLGELRRLRAQYPDDETCAGYEMTALYWSGRQADALSVYRRVRDRLVGQGLEPGPELAALHQRVLRGDLPGPDAPRKPPPARPFSPIPQRDTAFVGRTEEIRTLTAAGRDGPRVRIISGLPGAGKSRLAIEAAGRLAGEFPEGRLYLEFRANAEHHKPIDVGEALHRLLEMIGVPRSAQPDDPDRLASLWRRELAVRRMIVILDDVPDIGSVKPLVPPAGAFCVLITSRHRLRGIDDASELELDLLPEPDAIRLFRQIAGVDNAGDPEATATAVRLCGRLPLAIALTGGRLRRGGGPPDPVGAIEGPAGMNEQLVSVLDAAYRALTDSEQRLFRFLGMNPCPSFTTESAAAIAGMPLSVADTAIAALLDGYLVKYATDGGFRLHDLLREYAVFRARQDFPQPDRRAAELRLLDFYLSRADRADRELYPDRRPAAVPPQRPSPDAADRSRRWLESQWRNSLRVAEYAASHERQRHSAELAHVMARFLERQGFWEEATGAHARAVRACRDLGDRAGTARALIDLSRAFKARSLGEEALRYAGEALVTYQSAGDQHGEAIANNEISSIYYFFGKFREALAYGWEAQSLYIQSRDPAGAAEALFHCGICSMELGRLGESLDHFRESLAVFERSGNLYAAAAALNSLGEAELRQGYHRDALEHYQKALSISRDMGIPERTAAFRQNIGRVYLYKGDPKRALAEFKCALAVFRGIRDITWEARALCDCGDAFLTMGEYEQCLVYYRQAASAAEQIGHLHVRAIALCGVADVYRESGRDDEAIRHYNDALKFAQEAEEPYQRARILDGIAMTFIRAGKVSAGRIKLRQARDLYRAAGAIEANTANLRLQMLGDPPDGESSPPAASA